MKTPHPQMPWRDAARLTMTSARDAVRADVPGTQRGVALLVVLVTMAVMGALSTEFAYNTRANIWMAEQRHSQLASAVSREGREQDRDAGCERQRIFHK